MSFSLLLALSLVFEGTAYAQRGAGTQGKKNYGRQATEAFNELSDISRNVDKILEDAGKTGDMEQVQCISSKQASINALVDISEQAKFSIDSSIAKKDFVRADNELRKIAVSLSKAQQFSTEVEACLSTASSAQGGENTQVSVDASEVADMFSDGDPADFGMDSVENQIDTMENSVSSTTSASSSDSSAGSESIPPPPPTSPVN